MAENYTYGEIVYYKHAPGAFTFTIYVEVKLSCCSDVVQRAQCVHTSGEMLALDPSLLRRDPWPSPS